MIILNSKIVLHIPLCRWNGHIPVPIAVSVDKQTLINSLTQKLFQHGLESVYSADTTGYHKGKACPETTVTIFCRDNQIAGIVKMFINWMKENQAKLDQESIAFEVNNTMRILPLKSQNDTVQL